MKTIDVQGLDIPTVVAALYNAAAPAPGAPHHIDRKLTRDDVWQELGFNLDGEGGYRFETFHGRRLDVSISDGALTGPPFAAGVIAGLRKAKG